MAMNQHREGPGGGFLHILGILYLIKIVRRRRARRHAA